jgi:hypothetical protein
LIALKSILIDEEWTAKAVWWVRAVAVGVLVMLVAGRECRQGVHHEPGQLTHKARNIMPHSGNFPILLRLKFTLTADEFLGGQRVFNRLLARPIARFNYRYTVPVGLLLLGEGAVSFALRWNPGMSLVVFCFGAYLILFRALIAPSRLKKEFAQYPDLAGDREMEFGEEKILVSDVTWEKRDRLDALYSLRRNRQAFCTFRAASLSLYDT